MKAILRFLISIGSIVITYVIINLVLVGGQKLWHHTDQVKLDTWKAELEEQQREINQRERDLQALTSSLDQLNATISNSKAHAKSIEDQNPNGIPQEIYASYSDLIARSNSEVGTYNETLARYNALYDDYSQRVNEYNLKVSEANQLSEKIGETWYVVPVPAPRFSRHEEPQESNIHR